jgi:predicted transcriptional regulator
MAQKYKTREITIVDKGGTFQPVLRKRSTDKKSYDFESLSVLRKLLSNEKARLLHVIKTKNPSSLYELAKILSRDFKAVVEDVKLLQRFGLIELVSEKSGKRRRHKPHVVIDSLYIHLKI